MSSRLRRRSDDHQGHRRQGDHDETDRDVDEHHPAPRHVRREDPAEQQADGPAGAAHTGVDAKRPVAGRTLRKRRGDQGEGGRSGERGAGSLDGARHQQPRLGGGEAAEQRTDREHRDAGDEHPSPAVHVAEAATEQQQAAEGQRVGGHDPGQTGAAKAEIGLDLRQGDVHDRCVEHDHQLSGGDDDQGQTKVARCARRGAR